MSGTWGERLDKHFGALRAAREAAGLPVFALEHGLDVSEVSNLTNYLHGQLQNNGRPSRDWLAWVVYGAELGYDYDGQEYWASFENRTPLWTWRADRRLLRSWFANFHRTYRGFRPQGNWAKWFSIISWPVTHAILPKDLQTQLASSLYQLRFGVAARIKEEPASIGRYIAARGEGSSRFRNFLQQEELVGRIAVALLGGGELSSQGAGLSHMGESVDEIVVVPCAFLDAMADGGFVDIDALQDVAGDTGDDCEIGWSIVFARPAEVFVEMNVEHPVQAIFDLPMGARYGERLLGREQGGGHEQARQRLALVAFGGDAQEGGMANHERFGRRHHLGPSPLVAAMAKLAVLGRCRLDRRQDLARLLAPVAAISLQGEHIVSALIDDGLRHAAVTVKRVGSDDFVREIKQFHDLDRRLDLVLLAVRCRRCQAQARLGGKG